MTKTEISTFFSTGVFEMVYDFIANDAEWRIIEEESFIGKQAIINNCIEVERYFKTVTTNFEVHHVIADNEKVVVSEIATFLKDDKRVSSVSACDLYEFDDKNRIQKITSYCIHSKKKLAKYYRNADNKKPGERS